MTVEVYVAIVHPVGHKNFITTRLMLIIVIIIVLASITFHVSYTLSTSDIGGGKCYLGRIFPSPQMKSFFICINFILKYFIPVVVFVFCYTSMALSLKKNKVRRYTALIITLN